MGNIIEQGSFQVYANVRLDEARSTINEYSLYSKKQPFLFHISMMSFKNLKVYLVFCKNNMM